MKCKKGKLLILLIVIVSSLSGCFVSDEQKMFHIVLIGREKKNHIVIPMQSNKPLLK